MICDLQEYLYEKADAVYRSLTHGERNDISRTLHTDMYSFKKQGFSLERADEVFELLDLDLSYRVKEKLIWHSKYSCISNKEWQEKYYSGMPNGASPEKRSILNLPYLQRFCEVTGITFEFLLYSELEDFQWRFVYGYDRT